MSRQIAVTFDYRCPFARNAHEAVVNALREGTDIDYRFQAYSLDQVHVEEGSPAVWDRPADERGGGVLALEWGIAIRDQFPEQFLDAHVALFAARHDKGLQLKDEAVLRDAAAGVGIDVDAVAAEVATGRPLKALAAEHTEAVDRWAVFGVPTFCEGEEATFIRFMERGRADDLARAVELLDWSRFNEFKRTRVPR
ncbi:MAG TPA: DsbA family protein [Acidimicrobiia bacterium]|jgi:predicted DsbA family dithiol-disulfide isomerase|nr:DsbA family protein [Acidimicrobiia bacterium]